MPAHSDISTRWAVVEALKDGATSVQVAANLGLSRKTVQNIQKKFLATGTVEKQPRKGRPVRSF